MMNCSTVLVQNTWGVHLNFEGCFGSPPICPSWLTQLQQQDWRRRGIVVWNADLHIVAHLYAGFALELLEHLQGNDTWKTDGLIIGSPALHLSTTSADNPSPKMGAARILENQIELGADQVQGLIEFLAAQESLLKRISSYDKEDAEEALSKVYKLIAAYGRKVREGKKSDKLIKNTKPNICPFSFHAATISLFIKPPRFVMPRQNRSEPGSEKVNFGHLICQGWGSSSRLES